MKVSASSPYLRPFQFLPVKGVMCNSGLIHCSRQNQILLRFPHYLEHLYFSAAWLEDQSRFHPPLHKKADWWRDSRKGGRAMVCNLFNSGSSDFSFI